MITEFKIEKSQLYAGIIWIISAVTLAIYGILLLFNTNIPGVVELINFLSSIEEKYIYISAFLAIFIEGLYFIGSFFPGASLVIIITIISGSNGYSVFGLTILLVFIGWSLAGLVNIYLAKLYRNRIINLEYPTEYSIKDRVFTTWFPAFRSSYEVTQVIEGGNPLKVFLSSLRVKIYSTLVVGCFALIIPLIIDISNTSDKESFMTISIVFSISLIVGIRKVIKYYTRVTII